ncbi:MAG: hypothetical protein ACI4UK_04975 [Floccifex sp.]
MIDARIYNYSNLNEEDKKIFRSNLKIIESLNELKDEYKLKNPTALESLFSDTAARVLVDVQNQLMSKLIVSLKATIDGYDYDADELDTNDYLYGMNI